MGWDIVLEEALSEISHDRFGRSLRTVVARVDTLLRQGQDLQRRRPGLLKGNRTVLADGEPAQFAGDAGLDDVVLAPRPADANPEAGQLAIPVDGTASPGLRASTARLVNLAMRFAMDRKLLTSEESSNRLANKLNRMGGQAKRIYGTLIIYKPSRYQ